MTNVFIGKKNNIIIYDFQSPSLKLIKYLKENKPSTVVTPDIYNDELKLNLNQLSLSTSYIKSPGINNDESVNELVQQVLNVLISIIPCYK